MSLIQTFIVIVTIILLGVIFHRKNILNSTQIDGFGIFLLKLAMPCYLFSTTLKYDLKSLLYADYIFSFLVSFLTIIFIVAMIYYRSATRLALCIKMLAAGYPNAVIYTLPVITFLLKDPTSAIIGNILQLIVIQSIFILLMNIFRHREHTLLKKIFMVISTPIIIAPVLAIICNLTNFLPHPGVLQIAEHIGNGATSIALFTFGLNIGEVQFNRKTLDKPLLILIAIKNILHPIIAWIVGTYIFALKGYWLYSLIISSSAPTAFIVSLLAQQFQIEENLIKRTVAISAMFSLFSLLLITLFLQHVN